MISILAASKNNVIGNAGKLPWAFKKDMKWFRNATTFDLYNKGNDNIGGQNVVIMGRSTWESLDGKPLPKRQNWVLSSNPSKVKRNSEKDCVVFENLEELYSCINVLYTKDAIEAPKMVFCIGGAKLYETISPYALMITEIDGDFKGDTFFDWRDLGEDYKVDMISSTFSDVNQVDNREYNMRILLVVNKATYIKQYVTGFYRLLFQKALDKSGINLLP